MGVSRLMLKEERKIKRKGLSHNVHDKRKCQYSESATKSYYHNKI